jgi:Delta carbonic anhydrase
MRLIGVVTCLGLLLDCSAPMAPDLVCTAAGPQAPRDITSKAGTNAKTFSLAPPVTQMNLCNIHYHERAEHKGPGFSTKPAEGVGLLCNGTSALAAPATTALAQSDESCDKLTPGSTIEVHWVYTSCPVKVEKGKGLGACTMCENPILRVEAQVFLVVNDPNAVDFTKFDYKGLIGDFVQAASLPTDTGTPVVFHGSITGGSYNDTTKCSPAHATWSVRPERVNVHVGSHHKWCKSNVYGEHEAHDVRPLVTNPALLDIIP